MISINLESYYEALDFAHKAHAGQVRKKSGDPYIMHPMRVASILCLGDTLNDVGHPEAMVTAALLHDVVEDTQYTLQDLDPLFCAYACELVDAMTQRDEEPKAAYLKRVVNHSSDACLLKIADRVDNLRDARSTYSDGKLINYLFGTKNFIKLIEDSNPCVKGTDIFMLLEYEVAKTCKQLK